MQIVVDGDTKTLYWTNVRTHATSWLFNFSGQLPNFRASTPADGIGRFEGNPSDDGNFLALSDAATTSGAGQPVDVLIVKMNTTPPVFALSTIPPPNLYHHTGEIGWLSISPDGHYLVVKYAAQAVVTGDPNNNQNDDCIRVFDINIDPTSGGYLQVIGPRALCVDPSTLAVPVDCGYIGCGKDANLAPLDPAAGWVHPLKHADMMMDGSRPILVGVNSCAGTKARVGQILRVDLRQGTVSRLSTKSATPCHPENTLQNPIEYYCDEAPAMHVSCRNSARPGWAYVTYDSSGGKRFDDEIVAVRIDSSGAVERFAHTHSFPNGFTDGTGNHIHVTDAEPQAVPSRDGGRVVWASNWVRDNADAPVPNQEIKAYLVDAACAGCPVAETWTASGWQGENSILARSLSSVLALDCYRLKATPEVVNGRYRVQLRESEQEITTLDQVQLGYVDHAPNVRAYALGERVVLGTRVPPFRVTTHAGADITGLVSGTSNGYFIGEPGETLLVVLTPPGPGMNSATTTPGTGGLDPVEIDPGGGKDGSGSAQAMNAARAEASPTSRDEAILSSTGILVQGQDASGAWTTVRRNYPRQEFDEFLVDTLDHGPLRLVFVGNHKLRFVGRVLPASEAVTPQMLPLASAVHSRLGDVRAALLSSGDNTTALTPGDAIQLEFTAVPVPAGQVRDFFLRARGAYQSMQAMAEPASGGAMPQRFALLQNRPNPFASSTDIQFELPMGAMLRLEIFDAQGRRVRVLANRYYLAGRYSVPWDQRMGSGGLAQPGVYLYRLAAGPFRDRKRMVVLP